MVEGRKTTENEGWAAQSRLGCAPSYDMPYPFPVTAAKTRRKPVWRQASQTKWITGVAALFIVMEEAGQALVACVGPYPRSKVIVGGGSWVLAWSLLDQRNTLVNE